MGVAYNVCMRANVVCRQCLLLSVKRVSNDSLKGWCACWRGVCCVLRWLRVLALAWRVRLGVRFVSGSRVCPVLFERKSKGERDGYN